MKVSVVMVAVITTEEEEVVVLVVVIGIVKIAEDTEMGDTEVVAVDMEVVNPKSPVNPHLQHSLVGYQMAQCKGTSTGYLVI